MKPDVKARWVEALRSGKYEQNTDGVLSEDGSFCCLGVLCEIGEVPGWKYREIGERCIKQGYIEYTQHRNDNTITLTEEAFIPGQIMKQLDMDEYLVETAIALNDGGGHSFKDIADWLEDKGETGGANI